MRCFVALDLSREAKEELRMVQADLLDENIKCSKTKEFHLTLKFMGEVEDGKAEDIADALKNVKLNPFTLTLSRLGVFPSPEYIRVVWVGLAGDDELKRLYEDIEEVLRPFNFRDDFDFNPHLTIARVKYIKDPQEFAKKLRSIKIKPAKSEVKSFVLYKSTLTPKGPVYEKLEEFT